MLTAEEYWIPTLRVAEAQVSAGGEAFFYRFDRGPRAGKFAGRADHSSELPYVWANTADPHWAGVGTDDPALVHTMHAAWVAFIRDGRPVAAGLPDWPAYFARPPADDAVRRDAQGRDGPERGGAAAVGGGSLRAPACRGECAGGMRSRRLELPRGFPHKHLKLARLPFRHDRTGRGGAV